MPQLMKPTINPDFIDQFIGNLSNEGLSVSVKPTIQSTIIPANESPLGYDLKYATKSFIDNLLQLPSSFGKIVNPSDTISSIKNIGNFSQEYIAKRKQRLNEKADAAMQILNTILVPLTAGGRAITKVAFPITGKSRLESAAKGVLRPETVVPGEAGGEITKSLTSIMNIGPATPQEEMRANVAAVLGGLAGTAFDFFAYGGIRPLKSIRNKNVSARVNKALDKLTDMTVREFDEKGIYPADWNSVDKYGKTRAFFQEHLGNNKKFQDTVTRGKEFAQITKEEAGAVPVPFGGFDFSKKPLTKNQVNDLVDIIQSAADIGAYNLLKQYADKYPDHFARQTSKYNEGNPQQFLVDLQPEQGGILPGKMISPQAANINQKVFGENVVPSVLLPDEVKNLVENVGGKFKGISSLENSIYIDDNGNPLTPTVYFDDAKGSTKSVPLNQISTSLIQQKLGANAIQPIGETVLEKSIPPYSLGLEGGSPSINEAALKSESDYLKAMEELNKLAAGNPSFDVLSRIGDVRDMLSDSLDRFMQVYIEVPKQSLNIVPIQFVKKVFSSRPKHLFGMLQRYRIDREDFKQYGNDYLNIVEALAGSESKAVRMFAGPQWRGKKLTVQRAAEMAKEEGFLGTDHDIEAAGGLTQAFLQKVDHILRDQEIPGISGKRDYVYRNEFYEEQGTKQLEEQAKAQAVKDAAKNVGRIVREAYEQIAAVDVELKAMNLFGLEQAFKDDAVLKRFKDVEIPLMQRVGKDVLDRVGIKREQATRIKAQINEVINNMLKPHRERLKEMRKQTEITANFKENIKMVLEFGHKLVGSGLIDKAEFYKAVTRAGVNMKYLSKNDFYVVRKELFKGIAFHRLRKKIELANNSPVKDLIDKTVAIEIKERGKQQRKINKEIEQSIKKEGQFRTIDDRKLLNKYVSRSKKLKVNLFVDTRHLFADIDRFSGSSLHFIYENMMDANGVAKTNIVSKIGNFERLPGYADMTPEDWQIVSRALEGVVPEGQITSRYRPYVDYLRDFYKSVEKDIQFLEVEDYIKRGIIPSKSSEKEMEEAVNILFFSGSNWDTNKASLYTWLNGKDFGLVGKYNPRSISNPGVSIHKSPNVTVGRGFIEIRTDPEYHDYQITPRTRFPSYVRWLYNRLHLEDYIDAIDEQWAKTAHNFENSKDIENGISAILRTYLGKTDWTTPIEKVYNAVSRLAYSTIFMQPKLAIRNMLQNLVYYPNPVALNRFLVDFETRAKTITPERMDYFKKKIVEDLTKVLFESYDTGDTAKFLGGGVHADIWRRGIHSLNSFYDTTDKISRFWVYGAKLMELDGVFSQRILNDPKLLHKNLWEQTYFRGVTLEERKEALIRYVNGGIEDYKRYVAEKLVQNTNFVYDRAGRGATEQGLAGKTLLAMFTYTKSNVSLAMREVDNILRYGPASYEGRRVIFEMLLTGFVSATTINYLWKAISGDDEDAFGPLSFLSYHPGGLQIGAMTSLAEFLNNALRILQGHKTAIDQFPTEISKVADTFVPYWKISWNVIEAVLGYKNLDTLQTRRIRAFIDKRYHPKENTYKRRRTLTEAFQHAIFGSSPEQKRSPYNKSPYNTDKILWQPLEDILNNLDNAYEDYKSNKEYPVADAGPSDNFNQSDWYKMVNSAKKLGVEFPQTPTEENQFKKKSTPANVDYNFIGDILDEVGVGSASE